jgi:hypothetical protein
MSDETPRMDTTAIIRRFVAGEDDALAGYMSRYGGKLVRAANRLIRKLGTDPASLDGEGAVDMAFFELCQMGHRGRLKLVRDGEDVLKLMTVIVDRVIKDEKKHFDAAKRGGAGERPRGDRALSERKVEDRRGTRAAGGYFQSEVDLDQITSGEPLIVDVVLNKIDFETFLEKLPNESLRTICTMRHERYTIKEIACYLGVVRRTVERNLVRIQSIYCKLNPGLELR